MISKTTENSSTKKSKANRPSSTPSRNSVICIIRQCAEHCGFNSFGEPYAKTATPKVSGIYWATLRKAHIYNSKTFRDEMYNSPDYTFCVDTESVGSVKEAKVLAREYAKKLGLRIARYDERL